MNRIHRIAGTRSRPGYLYRIRSSFANHSPFKIPNSGEARKPFLISHFALRIEKRPKASSLITTLLVLVVLSTIVVAFMQSMSVERNVARSVKNRLVAGLAADAGYAAAQLQINMVVSNNPAFVIGERSDAANFGNVLVAGHCDLTNLTQMMPLISGNMALLAGYPTNANSNSILSYLNARTNTLPNVTVNINGSANFIETGVDTNKYRAPWVYLTNSDGSTNARFAYIMLDEWARVNPRYHGAGLDRTNATNWFSGAGVLPLVTTTNGILTTNQATNARAIVASSLTPHSLAQAFANRSDYESKKHLLTTDDTPSYDVIPNSYTNGGLPKYDINDLATNIAYGATAQLRAENIASIIKTNLVSFASRDVGSQSEGLTNTTYLNRLAASIVDYIDSDTIPTSANNGEPAGKELAPYAVMVAERNTWVSETPASPAPPPVTVKIRTEFFVQLWNPNTVAVSGNISLQVKNRQYIELPNGGPQTDLLDYSAPDVAVNLQPNEMRAYKFAQTDQDFVHQTARPSSTPSNYPRWPTTSSIGAGLTGHPQFRLFWNGSLLDMNRQEPEMDAPASSGLVRSSPGSAFGSVGIQRISFNFSPPNSPNTVGDGRASFLIISDWAGLNNIASALWQGRQTDMGGRRQDFSSMWAQRDYIREDIPQGTAMGSLSSDPSAIASSYTTNSAQTAPAYVKNGRMQSIGELGHIFDPAQVNDTGGNASGGTPPSYFRPAGGRSLRIGQPEFSFGGGSSSWDQDGFRAIQLIDLFSVNATNTNSAGFPVTFGRVNVNTAPEPVLEALFLNIKISSDTAASGATVSTNNVVSLAERLITNRPYARLSDLYRILPDIASGTNFSPVVPTQIGGGTTNLALMDRAREEVFGKFVQLVTTQSRAFRVFVVGQALDQHNGRVLSQAVIESSLVLDSATNTKLKSKYSRNE